MRRAMSLLETVLAVFLLLAGSFTCLAVLRSALGHGTKTRRLAEAQQIGAHTLDAIRAWAYEPDNYFGDWSPYNDDEHSVGDYLVHTRCPGREDLASPNASLELPRLAGARLMREAYMPVRVSVRWSANNWIHLTTHIGQAVQPVRNAQPMVITRGAGPSDPVPVSGTVEWSADLYASDGSVIPGVSVGWQVVPNEAPGFLPGNALFLENRASLGRSGELIHRFYNGDPSFNLPPREVPGSVIVRAEAVYNGRSYFAESSPVELAP
jgi:hypothetical protein